MPQHGPRTLADLCEFGSGSAWAWHTGRAVARAITAADTMNREWSSIPATTLTSRPSARCTRPPDAPAATPAPAPPPPRSPDAGTTPGARTGPPDSPARHPWHTGPATRAPSAAPPHTGGPPRHRHALFEDLQNSKPLAPPLAPPNGSDTSNLASDGLEPLTESNRRPSPYHEHGAPFQGSYLH
jgi:hypothetical protein